MPKSKQSSNQEQLLKEITNLLQKFQIPYMVTGALSVIFYGRPRASHDIDFIIDTGKKDIKKVKKVFATLPHDFVIQEHLIEDAILNKFSFNILHLPTMLKLDFFLLKNDEFDKVRFQRRKTLTVFGQKMTFASAEDTILIKLLWYKDSRIEKHLIDAAFIYQIQNGNLDKSYLSAWAKKHKTTTFLKELAVIDLQSYY